MHMDYRSNVHVIFQLLPFIYMTKRRFVKMNMFVENKHVLEDIYGRK